MLISHRKKFIYTKTIKTAGTSVEAYFEKYCLSIESDSESSALVKKGSREEYIGKSGIIGYRGNNSKGKEYINHMSAKSIKNKVGSDVWQKYFKFCVIRNPFDKLVSYYHFIKKQARKNHPIKMAHGENDIDKFRNWIKGGGRVLDRDKYLINGEICIDYFIYFEELHKGIKEVCERLNIPFEPKSIPKLKYGLRPTGLPVKEYYDQETQLIVENMYRFEVSRFNYSLPS